MKWSFLSVLIVLFSAAYCSTQENDSVMKLQENIPLPEPRLRSEVSIEEALQKRRSVREYADISLTLHEISQVLWSAQGITDRERGFRTSPSAGATFPLELYIAVANVSNLSEGVYRYNQATHSIERILEGDKRRALYDVALRQPSILSAPAVIVITGVIARTEGRYGERAWRYVYMEAGHAAQNVYLQCVSLDMGAVVIGAFHDDAVARTLQLQRGEYPLYILPVGKIRGN